MSDLTDFLLARIQEDEDRAKRAAFGWGSQWASETDDVEEWSVVHADGKRDMVGCEDGDVTEHIARHDPARVLAECEAKRRVVEEYRAVPEGMQGPYRAGLGRALRCLALPYADHPDYRRFEWRP